MAKVVGPGLIFASMAIGVSHLVQSTRAGANYGFSLLWVIVAANIFKYPFFEYASRYASATGESLIDGYNRLGKGPLWIYFFVTLGSMFFVMGAVGFVTVGFLDNLLGLSGLFPSFQLFPTVLLFGVCTSILFLGKYAILDNIIKVIGVVLVVSTLIAFVLTIIHGPVEKIPGFVPNDPFSDNGIIFIIALMGWMPTAVDMSSWSSLWTIEKIKTTGYHPSLKETVIEFNIGYWVAAVLSLCFLTLGAFLMYGTGVTMSDGSADFANQVVTLYTSTIGEWSHIIISASSFSIMFGTSIAVFDGYARALERTVELAFLSEEESTQALQSSKMYNISLAVLAIGAFLLIVLFLQHFKLLIDIAMTISFLIAPIIAIANTVLVSKKYVPEEAVPPRCMLWLSYCGIVFLTGFALFFLYTRLF